MKKKPELLAPAGNLEKMKTAFAFGADAVYLGIPDFSLRVRINDFTIEQIESAVEHAHGIGKKVYVTVNIYAHNRHLDKLAGYIKKLEEIKIDGLFVSDPGVMAEIRKTWKDAPISLSTQANCTNWQSAKFWHEQGIKRVILGRELSIKEIKEIGEKIPDLELETFIHGALCMAYSGRCFLSKYINGRDANLGDCSQPCRWQYDVTIQPKGHEKSFKLFEEEHGSYLLNSQDLCLIKRLPELVDAGIVSFKIEGRAKSVYYLANIIGAYRKAIDMMFDEKLSSEEIKKEAEFLYSELESKLFHRGYTEGFMFEQGEQAQNLDNSHNTPAWEFCGQVLNSKKINDSEYEITIKVHNSIDVGDEIEVIMPGYDIIQMKMGKMLDKESREEKEKVHGGGGGQVIIIKHDKEIPELSVLRRKLNKKEE